MPVSHDAFDAETDAYSQQMKSWFRWRQSNLTHTNGPRQATSQFDDVLGLGLPAKTCTTRLLSKVQKYSNMYYSVRVAPTVQADLAGLGRPPSHADILSTVKRVTQEIWDAEDEDTRAIIDRELADDREKKHEAVNAAAVEGRERTPAEYQR